MSKRNKFLIAPMLVIALASFLCIAMVYFFDSLAHPTAGVIRLYYFAGFTTFLIIAITLIMKIPAGYFAGTFFGLVVICGVMVVLYFLHFGNIFNNALQIVFSWPMLLSGFGLTAALIFFSVIRENKAIN